MHPLIVFLMCYFVILCWIACVPGCWFPYGTKCNYREWGDNK